MKNFIISLLIGLVVYIIARSIFDGFNSGWIGGIVYVLINKLLEK